MAPADQVPVQPITTLANQPPQQDSVSQIVLTAQAIKEEEKEEEYQDMEALKTQLQPQNAPQLNLNAPVFVPSFANNPIGMPEESGFVFDPSMSLQQNPDFMNLVALVN